MVNGLGDNEIIIKICKTVQTIILRNKSGSFSLPSPSMIKLHVSCFFLQCTRYFKEEGYDLFFFEKFEVMETGVLSRNASFRLDQMQIMKEPKKHFLI